MYLKGGSYADAVAGNGRRAASRDGRPLGWLGCQGEAGLQARQARKLLQWSSLARLGVRRSGHCAGRQRFWQGCLSWTEGCFVLRMGPLVVALQLWCGLLQHQVTGVPAPMLLIRCVGSTSPSPSACPGVGSRGTCSARPTPIFLPHPTPRFRPRPAGSSPSMATCCFLLGWTARSRSGMSTATRSACAPTWATPRWDLMAQPTAETMCTVLVCGLGCERGHWSLQRSCRTWRLFLPILHAAEPT